MNSHFTEIQNQFCSQYNKRKLCSYDVEYIDGPTKPLIHQTSRFVFFEKGEGTITINSKPYHIEPNTFMALLPWDISEINEVTKPFQLIKCIYNSDFVTQSMKTNYNTSNELFGILTPIGNVPVLHCTDEEKNKILSIFEEIKNEVGIESIYDVEEEKELTNVYVTNKLCELLILYKRYITKKDVTHHDGAPVELDKRNNIFKYMYSHLSEKQTLTILSGIMYMSESSISKYILDVTGYTFTDLLNEMRIVKTMDLLTYTNMTLNDIAELVGFSDASHVIRVFTNKTGISPKTYRSMYNSITNIFDEKDRSLNFKVITYIYDNYANDITVQDVASKFNISVIEVNRILLFQVEKNFDDFLIYLRITKGCELLLTTNYDIIDIAIQVGFNTVKTFNRNFMKLKNMTPSSFRKNILFQQYSESIKVEKLKTDANK